MDLIDYLQSYTKDSKGKPIMRKRRRTKGKPGRPRRARGYGQRSSKYNSSNNSTFNNNIEKLLTTILATVTKPNTPSVESLTQGKEFIPRERERQLYSQVGTGQKEFFGSIKKPVSQKFTQVTGFDIDRIEQQKALLYNTETDFDMRVENILEKQKELINHLGSIENINPEEATRIRKENLKLKEEILGQNLKIQELLNDAEDLNDFKSLVDKQNKMIEQTTNNFATIDNDLSRRQQEEIEKLQKSTNVISSELGRLVEEVGGRREELEQLKLETQEQKELIDLFETRDKLKQQVLEQEQELTGELAGKLKTFVDISKEQEQSGILGVLGRDVLAGVREDIATEEGMRQQIRSRTEQRIMEDIAKNKLKKEKKKTKQALFDLENETQALYRAYGETQEMEKSLDREISKRLGQEIISKKRKGYIDLLKGEKEDLNTLLERAEEGIEQQQDSILELEEAKEKQQQAITRGLGREIVGRKKDFFKELGLVTKITEANEEAIEAKRAHNTLLEKYAKAEQQKANSQAQLRGLKQYADNLAEKLVALGDKGTTAQVQYFDRKISDLENNLAMEKSFVEDMKLKLEKSEEKEQALRQQLREYEDEVDRQASRELERVVSGLSDI